MATLWFDIETIPGAEMPPLDSIQAPGNYKNPETILKYQQENQEAAWRKQALNSLEGQIVCLSYAVDKDPVVCLGLWEMSEREILVEISNQVNSMTRWAGFNIRSFDLNWLWHRAVKHGIDPLIAYIPRQRYSHEVLDVREYWTGGDTYAPGKMQSIADFLGLESYPVSGADIFDLYQSGKYDEIMMHCNDDVRVCREIAIRMGLVS